MEMSRGFISISSQRTRLWLRRAWGHFFDWTDTVNSGAQHFLLVEYATQHWVDHARFGNVSLWVRDASKLHFAAWLQMHDIDEDWVSHLVSNAMAVPHSIM